MRKTRKRIFEIVATLKAGDKASKVFNAFIFLIIIISVLGAIIETTAWGKTKFIHLN